METLNEKDYEVVLCDVMFNVGFIKQILHNKKCSVEKLIKKCSVGTSQVQNLTILNCFNVCCFLLHN